MSRVAGEKRRRIPPSSVEFQVYRTPQRPSRRTGLRDVEPATGSALRGRGNDQGGGTTTTATRSRSTTRKDDGSEPSFVHHHLSLDYEYYGIGMENEEEEAEDEDEEVLGEYTILTVPPRGRSSSRYPSATLTPSLPSSTSLTSYSSSSSSSSTLLLRSLSCSSRLIPSPPPFNQLPTRKRSIADQRFYRVYALENSIRTRAGKNGVELEWYGSRSITMCKPLKVVCSTERNASPLREQGVCF